MGEEHRLCTSAADFYVVPFQNVRSHPSPLQAIAENFAPAGSAEAARIESSGVSRHARSGQPFEGSWIQPPRARLTSDVQRVCRLAPKLLFDEVGGFMKKKLKEFYSMIEEIETAMFTTRRRDGRLVSRPMANQVAAAGADLWFVTYDGAPKLADIARDPHVNLSYYKDRTREWVSVSGLAKLSTNRRKIRELYRPDWRAWFADNGGEEAGTPEDPRIVLIGVDIESAHFMEVNKPQVVVLYELVKGLVTKTPPNLGKTQRITRAETRNKVGKRKPASRK
jgi:general stress protein 26